MSSRLAQNSGSMSDSYSLQADIPVLICRRRVLWRFCTRRESSLTRSAFIVIFSGWKQKISQKVSCDLGDELFVRCTAEFLPYGDLRQLADLNQGGHSQQGKQDSFSGIRVLNSRAMCKHQTGKVLEAAGDGLHCAVSELLVRVGLNEPCHCPHEPRAQPVLLQGVFGDQIAKFLKRSSAGCIHRAVCEY